MAVASPCAQYTNYNLYCNVGGTFKANGQIQHFSTARSHNKSNSYAGITLNYAEGYQTSNNAIVIPNALSRFRLGFRSTSTGTIYWTSKGLYNIWSTSIPTGRNYTISVQSYNNEYTSMGQVNIRFGGTGANLQM